jgi:hypothetical protein
MDKEIVSALHKYLDVMKSHKMRPNIWSIIEYGRRSYEVRYSKFIRWLLDPGETHGVKDLFAKELWKTLKSESIEWSDKSKAKAEYNNIDIHIYDKEAKRYLVIELKVHSDAQSQQLKRYADKLESRAGYKDVTESNRLYVFLKPDGSKPAVTSEWDKRWVCLSYAQLCDILNTIIEKVDESSYDYKKDAKKLIADFRDDLEAKYSEIQFEALASEFCKEKNVSEVEAAVEALNYDNYDKEYLIKNIESYRKGFQNKTPSQVGQELIRKLFNELVTSDKHIDTLSPENFGKERKEDRETTSVKDVFKNRKLSKIRLTSGKGQGLNLYFENGVFVGLSVANRGTNPMFLGSGIWFSIDDGTKKVDGQIQSPSKAVNVNEALENYEKEKTACFNTIDDFLAELS